MAKSTPDVSVLTPTIPGREEFLGECIASVAAQTYRVFEHLTLLDKNHDGCSATVNRLAKMAKGEWLLPLADDDLLLPGCLAVLLASSADADVVYSPPLVWDENPAQFCGEPPIIPATALICRKFWERLGGYRPDLNAGEDRDLWCRAMEKQARFVRADIAPTWVYRFWRNPNGTPGNKSRQ